MQERYTQDGIVTDTHPVHVTLSAQFKKESGSVLPTVVASYDGEVSHLHVEHTAAGSLAYTLDVGTVQTDQTYWFQALIQPVGISSIHYDAYDLTAGILYDAQLQEWNNTTRTGNVTIPRGKTSLVQIPIVMDSVERSLRFRLWVSRSAESAGSCRIYWANITELPHSGIGVRVGGNQVPLVGEF